MIVRFKLLCQFFHIKFIILCIWHLFSRNRYKGSYLLTSFPGSLCFHLFLFILFFFNFVFLALLSVQYCLPLLFSYSSSLTSSFLLCLFLSLLRSCLPF